MGTPELAVPALTHLLESQSRGLWQVVGVITQPDRRQGRRRQPAFSPIKQVAQGQGLPLLQPETFRRNPEARASLAAWCPDLAVVMAFGQILPRSVLRIPARGCVNIHTSLLPALRGASPIATALLQGLTITGTSLMLMDAGMDTGPVLAQAEMPIAPRDTTLSLGERLAHQGAELLVQILPRWLAGKVQSVDQGSLPGEASVCGLWTKAEGQIDWTKTAQHIERQIRACYPWPSAFCQWQGRIFKILQADWDSKRSLPHPPGHMEIIEGKLGIQTGAGILFPLRVQLAGKSALSIEAFLHGAGRGMPGTRLD